MKKLIAAAVLLLLVFGLVLGCPGGAVSSIPLGDGVPAWQPEGAYTAARLPENAAGQKLTAVYTDAAGVCDLYVYSFPREAELSLEEFGQQLAAERHIFCNMMTDRGVPVAVLNYFDRMDGEPYLVQAYIYDAGDHFAELCMRFRTDDVPFGRGELSIHMPRAYEAQEQTGGALLSDTVYTPDRDRLPPLRVRQFAKDAFPVETVEPELLDAVSEEQLAALAADGWTPDELVTAYGQRYELSKGEVTCRNGLDHAFLGYIDDGVFHTRAFIDSGDTYILLSAEAEVPKFQHVTNALIDAVE